ncbi:TRAP transporter small permease [Cellulosilyticum sp. I15G10I2]|uniref:TRAP transporter small permease n=1 Tax=Cellulosilyticum sp. I15G10I2 TaxID=1892843 RepID=UPI00085C5B25|nr:TRAP transporter small permease [Cellulosilyticum sp. I15G10I2]
MQTIRKNLNKIAVSLSIAVMGIMVLLVTWQVITRYVFNNPSTFTEQLARYMFVWLVVINAAYIFGRREHMNIGFVHSKCSPKLQMILSLISELVVLVFVLAVLVGGGIQAVKLAMPQMDSALPIKMGIIYLALPISGVLTTAYTICNITDLIRRSKTA